LEIQNVARRKLQYLQAAENLQDLFAPPGNRLEALKGKWKGFCSIRINDQWRICFQWTESAAHNVAIKDYH
jgi:proteic killer suppression protein